MNPARPAQPAKPAEPAKPYSDTGGYVGPVESAADPATVLPIGGTALGPPPSSPPGAAPPVTSGPSQGPPQAPGIGGVPPAAQQLGIDEKGYETIVDELKQAPDPAEFQVQFAQLMEQRSMIAPPSQGTGTGQLPTKEYEGFLKKRLRDAVAYFTTPKDYGGMGYTPGQAKMYAVMEARKRWPNIDGAFWAANLPSGETSAKDLGVTSVGPEGERAKIEVSPQRVARLDPAKIADYLTKPELKTTLEWAREYKERVGPTANAGDFVQFVYDKHLSGLVAGPAGMKVEVDKAKATYEQAQAAKALADAKALESGRDPKVDDPTKDQTAASLALAQANATLQQAEATAVAGMDTDTATRTAMEYVLEDQELMSVAAALENIH